MGHQHEERVGQREGGVAIAPKGETVGGMNRPDQDHERQKAEGDENDRQPMTSVACRSAW